VLRFAKASPDRGSAPEGESLLLLDADSLFTPKSIYVHKDKLDDMFIY